MNTCSRLSRDNGEVTIRLPERMRKLRRGNGYTQAEIAASLSIHRSTYAYYEIGKTRPTLEMLALLARFYDVPLEYLLGVEEEEPTDEHENGRPE